MSRCLKNIFNIPDNEKGRRCCYQPHKHLGCQAHVTHIQVPIDDTTAVSYINNMGVSKSLLLNKRELKSGNGVLLKTSGPWQCTLQRN